MEQARQKAEAEEAKAAAAKQAQEEEEAQLKEEQEKEHFKLRLFWIYFWIAGRWCIWSGGAQRSNCGSRHYLSKVS